MFAKATIGHARQNHVGSANESLTRLPPTPLDINRKKLWSRPKGRGIVLSLDLRPSSPRRLDLRSASDARDTKTCLRSTRKRSLRELHERICHKRVEFANLRRIAVHVAFVLLSCNEGVRVPRRRAFVSRRLSRTEGWNGAAAFDEGRGTRKPMLSHMIGNWTFKSKRRRGIPAAKPLDKRRGSWSRR